MSVAGDTELSEGVSAGKGGDSSAGEEDGKTEGAGDVPPMTGRDDRDDRETPAVFSALPVQTASASRNRVNVI